MILLIAAPGCKKVVEQPIVHQTVVVNSDTVGLPAGAIIDASGNIYMTMMIGTQRWMVEDLRTTRYSNGDPIPYVPVATQWSNASVGSWTYFDNDAAYGELYGKLYNWYTVTDPRNICPDGWHVPMDEEWMVLEEFLGIPSSALANMGQRGVAVNAGGQLKAMVLWNSPNTGASNSSGFWALPSGGRAPAGSFYNTGSQGYWWSSSEGGTDQAFARELWWNHGGINRILWDKRFGSSIRCVQD